MPYYVVKITTADGDIRQPIVANSGNEEDACELVKYLTDSRDTVEAKQLRLNEDESRKTFGDVPLNHGIICWDWMWSDDGAGDEIEIIKDAT